NHQGFGAMPAGLIKEDNGVRSEGDFGCDLVEMELHGFAVASRQHEGGAGSTGGTDRTKQISRLGPLIVGDTGAWTFPGPAIGELVLLAHPHLVLKTRPLPMCRVQASRGFPPHARRSFLNASMASAFCL